MSYKLNAGPATTAWLNAGLASSKDKLRGVLYRTVLVEFFAEGTQFVGCNGHALFRTWVPFQDNTRPDSPFPTERMKPRESVIVRDIDRFGDSFMKTLASAAKEGEELLLLEINYVDTPKEPALGEALQPRVLTLRAMGQRLDLRIMEDTYPNWRALKLGVKDVERVDGMSVAPKMFKLIGQLKGVSRLDLEFTGEKRQVRFHTDGDVETRGMIMPMLRQRIKEAEGAGDNEELDL